MFIRQDIPYRVLEKGDENVVVEKVVIIYYFNHR